MKPTDEDVHIALRLIIADVGNKALDYAIPYAKAGLLMDGTALQMQVPYVLGNITGWRDPDAKAVRVVLNE